MSDEAIGAGLTHTGAANDNVKFTERADATVTTYPQRLLDVAKGLIGTEEYSIAVVVAHIACEVAVDRASRRLSPQRGSTTSKSQSEPISAGPHSARTRIGSSTPR